MLVLNALPTRRALLIAALDTWDGIECSADAAPTASGARECTPDVVLIDVSTRKHLDRSTELVLRKAMETYPNAAMVLLSGSSSPSAKELMRRFPLTGWVTSSQKPETIAVSLKLAREGIAVLPKVLLDQLRRPRSGTPALMRKARSSLRCSAQFTGRQADVVHLLMEGLSNKAIAYRLGITESTVKNHVRSIMARMSVISRTQVILALLDRR